ncbi:MAG: LPS assembly lipoprotein LptE [Desulfatiglandaceae bacterium]
MKNIKFIPIIKWLVCLMLLSSFSTGCGYSISSPAGPAGPAVSGISGLAVSLVESPSSNLGFEAEFTRMLRKEFISYSGLPLMSERDAPYVLECRVQKISTRSRRYKSTRTVVQGEEQVYWRTSGRRMSVDIDARLVEQATGNVIWHDDSIVETADWDLGADSLSDRDAQRAAVRRLAERVAAKLYSRTVDRF